MTQYADPVLADFARRTRANLELVQEEAKKHPDKAFEVTQLINSMLGLLVFPREHYLDQIPTKSISQLRQEGWPLPTVEPGYSDAPNLRQLLRLLRNSISHFGVEFLSDNSGEIIGLKLRNTDPATRKITWKATIRLEDLEDITNRFIALVLAQPPA